MTAPLVQCDCGHAFSSHREDTTDPWATIRCKTCGCAGFQNRDEAAMQGDPEDVARQAEKETAP
jgi:hypothetical protein